MDDKLYKKALRRRSELLEQIKNIEIFLQEYQSLRDSEFADLGEELSFCESRDVNSSYREQKGNIETGESSSKRANNPKPVLVIEQVKRILRSKQQPMTRVELLGALRERGILISGVDPAKVLGTNLWRSKEIEKAESGGYWIKGEPMLRGDVSQSE